MKTLKLYFLTLLTSTFILSCSSDDDNPVPVNEEEVITTLRLTLTPQGGGTDIVMLSQDLDGDGPNPPVVTSGDLTAGVTYNGTIQVLNELETPAEDITIEVNAEDDEHQFFYEFTGTANSSFAYTDMDGNGDPVGITITLTAGTASMNNSLTVTLIHEPLKDAAGVSGGDISNAGGETDIEVTFTYDVN